MDLLTGLDSTLYFKIAREREQIRRRRLIGEKPPWTEDAILKKYRFTNVHREHDATTAWFRENIRTPLAAEATTPEGKLKLVEATVAFRWFNLIATGEVLKDLLLGEWDRYEASRRLADRSPVVTGAYMIRTEMGMSKADGVCFCIERAFPKLPKMIETWGDSIQQATKDLTAIYGLGPFLAYEITTDLRWTPILNQAEDILTWANAGPGCARGLSRLYDVTDAWRWNRGREEHQIEMNAVMQYLLALSRDPENWPTEWEPWEMREVEMWACEYDKYCRGLQNEHLKRLYRYD